jgi:outer membrane protein assembly factor BamB
MLQNKEPRMHGEMRRLLVSYLCSSVLMWGCISRASAADWPMYRGNAQRTGALDDQAGPRSPKLLWSYSPGDGFIASPATDGKRLFVSGLGAFNTPSLHALPLEGQGTIRELWSKRPPSLKQPIVCPPAIAGGAVIFGDGMHQTSGAVLHCLSAEDGRSAWQLTLPGDLVHIESSPLIAGGKVYFAAGAAGVLCIDPSRITIEGRETDAASARQIIDARWKQLREQYEKDKVKDPDFAIAPTEDALPKAEPVKLWQKGANQWHVDAAPNLVGNRLLVASAFLEEERVGKRALLCLDAGTGQTTWTRELDLNPWSGPTIAGELVILGASNIRLDPKLLPGRGQVLALDLASGGVKWKKDLPGAIVAPVAVAGKLAIVASGDNKIRAFDLISGEEKWAYAASSAFFAGAAVSADTVYTADLRAVVHAVNLADGKPVWKLDLAADASAKSAGTVYGSPILAGGRLYVATCDLDAAAGAGKTAVMCIGEK